MQGDSNFEAARHFADFGLTEKRAGRRESASGPGSSLKTAEPALKMLRQTVRDYDVRSVLDLGCGDWHWMRHAGFPDFRMGRTVSYEGWDASPEMIEELNSRFADDAGQIRFSLTDISTSEIPPVDLIIARDVFFHLPKTLTVTILDRIRAHRPLLLSTSFDNVSENHDIEDYLPIQGWGFYQINLNISPFDLGSAKVASSPEPGGEQQGSKAIYQSI